MGRAEELPGLKIDPAGQAAEPAACPTDLPFDLEDYKDLIPRYSRAIAPHTDDFSHMRDRGVIRVLTDYSRTNYFLHDGRFFGFEYSLFKEYEKFLNREVHSESHRVHVEFIPMPRGKLVSALRQGVGDIAAAGFETLEVPAEGVVATDPYLENVQRVLVTYQGAATIDRLSDLAGRQVYVRPVEPDLRALAALNSRLNAQGLEPVRPVGADPALGAEDLLEMVNAGIVDLTLVQKHIAVIWSRMMPQLTLYEPTGCGPAGALVWLTRGNNPELRENLNRFVKTHKKGTLLGNIYFSRYFENARWLKNPLEAEEQARLSRYLPLFQKYADRYGIDWRLLAAVAFQESGLNPGSRSRKGAVGIMQVLPSTARDRRVGISDPFPVENNIHAGAKYLALLRDEYFSESQIPSESRIRFALAAYNAGPTKIRRCRQLAGKMGYDVNRWFQHCEQAAIALHITETVEYVNNINKYLLAYRLAERLDCVKQMVRDGRMLDS